MKSHPSHLLLKVCSASILYCRSVCVPSTCACVWRQATWLASLLVRSTSTRAGPSASVKTSKLDPRARQCCCVIHLYISMMFQGDQQHSSTFALVQYMQCLYQLLLQQLPWSDIWCLKVLTSILLHARNKMTSSEMLFVTMLYKAYPAITLTRQRGGYLHIIDFMEIPLRLKKLVKRLYFLDTDTNKARNVRSLDTKAIPFKCPGAAVPVRGAEPAGQGSAQQHSGPREPSRYQSLAAFV